MRSSYMMTVWIVVVGNCGDILGDDPMNSAELPGVDPSTVAELRAMFDTLDKHASYRRKL